MVAFLHVGSPVVPQNVTKSTEQPRAQPGNCLLCIASVFCSMRADSKILCVHGFQFSFECFNKALFFCFFQFYLDVGTYTLFNRKSNMDTITVIVKSTPQVLCIRHSCAIKGHIKQIVAILFDKYQHKL